MGTPEDVESQTRAFAESLGVPFLTALADRPASVAFVERIPIAFARNHCLLGLADDGPAMPILIGNADSWPLLDVVSRYLQRPVRPLFARRGHVHAAVNAAYQEREGQTQKLLESLDRENVFLALEQLASHEDLLDTDSRAPVVQLVNLILFDAVRARASDVHVQPYEDELVVRFRIDGILFDTFHLSKNLQEEILSRIKIIGRMNIAEKRLPQDGRATVQMGDRLIDLRIASLPSSHGERIVVRLLDKSARLYTLNELGMESAIMHTFGEIIHLEHGLILVTGPTGSGKSTTLYAALQEINTVDQNVLTLEDPIEYQLDGISQTQINEKKGLTFARGLRNVLRQDPDIIMVGEIRDHETAVMAIQSALTGHLVFSTLHTNDAASAVTRLLDLGIEPYLLASSLIAVLAQRLVRRICPDCAEQYTPSDDELQRLGLDRGKIAGRSFWRGGGCDTCRKSGYRERLGLFELLFVDATIRDQIQSRANATQIRDTAVARGMRLLCNDGVEKLLSGKTSSDEVNRVAARYALSYYPEQ